MLLDDILTYNQKFVEDKSYEAYETDKFPNKRAVIFTCMDTRLVELLPKALNLQNGDVKMVKNAGAILNDSYDSTMKSILVAIYALQADEVFVIGHHRCGMTHFDTDGFIDIMKERGIEQTTIENLDKDPKEWLTGFDDVEASVEQSTRIIENHPLLPEDVPVHGLVIDPATGKLDLVKKGY
ncbi:carbonic anhydrase [Gracilibacillus halophilus YIM-C55.5]|uniref:carbonic anhydrase n=1 Tax=Gracilibacillus halophilus YIM-C55.5 TaxID=1308866 RepID=N4WP60_9BACI|nr:carbonic anhydrase [Gracilibacillus halophilus]ENH96275.1 carbonic anhydrase [Gracilibacillus halophilus YIM-C55.5]